MLKPYQPQYDVPAPSIVWELELSTIGVARLLGVNQSAVVRWCKDFGLPHRVVGRGKHRRIKLVDLRRWLIRFLRDKAWAQWKYTPAARRRIAAFVGATQ